MYQHSPKPYQSFQKSLPKLCTAAWLNPKTLNPLQRMQAFLSMMYCIAHDQYNPAHQLMWYKKGSLVETPVARMAGACYASNGEAACISDTRYYPLPPPSPNHMVMLLLRGRCMQFQVLLELELQQDLKCSDSEVASWGLTFRCSKRGSHLFHSCSDRYPAKGMQ